MIFSGFRFGLLLQIAVGPICLLIFQTAVSKGFLSAFIGTLEVAFVDAVYILLAILGIGSVMEKRDKTKKIIGISGGVLIILFGLNGLLVAANIKLLPEIRLFGSGGVEALKPLLLTLSNPLTILFWIGVFSSKISDTLTSRKDMYLFGFGAVISTVIFLSLVSLAGNFAKEFISPVFQNYLNIFISMLLIFLGMKTLRVKN